jgi:hypothetical protein
MNASESLLSTLAEITGTGKFHSTGAVPFFFPGLEVEGFGELAFPVAASQVRDLILLSEAAPYGQGSRTIFDETVRKCWQIDAAHFSFGSSQWSAFLERTLDTICEDLGIRGEISAHPYKLLIYGPGGHFKAHKDTEKLDAMFGTLVIALPSKHEGGRLFIRHDGRESVVDFSREQHRYDFQHAAFFADCEHEVEPVLGGYRCCIVYNLRLDKGDSSLLNLPLTSQASTLLPSLAQLRQECPGQLSAILLDHSYTEANISLANLKGSDQARAHALLAAAREAGFHAHLALVTFHQSGELEDYEHDYRGRYHDVDDDPANGSMGEINDESLTISHWRNDRDQEMDHGVYHIAKERLITTTALGDEEPDEKEAEGYTGNAGCTMDYWYRRAAIVLWAADDWEIIQCSYTFLSACAALKRLSLESNTAPGSPFHRLATAVIDRSPDVLAYFDGYHGYGDFSNDPFRAVFASLAETGARDLLERLLGKLPDTAFIVCNPQLWSKLHKAFGVELFEAAYSSMLKENTKGNRRALFQVLASLATRTDSAALARSIAARLAGFGVQTVPAHYWSAERNPKPPGDREEARAFLTTSHFLEAPKVRQAVRDFLHADGSLSYIRGILGPVLLDKSITESLRNSESMAPEILAYAKAIMRAEVSRPLAPYGDWTRPCPDPAQESSGQYSIYGSKAAKRPDPLRELATFMSDPNAETHDFARPQDERSQIEQYISRHFLDLDHVTIRKGSPHKLACKKNESSYQHALLMRSKDQELLGRLEKLQVDSLVSE